MSKENNIAIQQKFGEAVNTGNLEELRTIVSDTCIEHDPAPDQKPGAQGYIDFFTMMRSAFPDFKIKVVNLVADEESVSFAYSASGTHSAEFMGLPATGKTFEARGMQTSRFEDGKMVERWGSSDELGILKQFGASVR
jgi:steroid delta-isomerase-like uncharacterized protein